MNSLKTNELKLTSDPITADLLNSMTAGYDPQPEEIGSPMTETNRLVTNPGPESLGFPEHSEGLAQYPTMLTHMIESSMDDLEIRAIAKKNNRTLAEVEKLKRIFDKYDTDHSGALDLDELGPMISQLLGDTDGELTSPQRKEFYLRQFATSNIGQIPFAQFVKVFLKLFGSSQHPVAAFYASLNPLSSKHKA